MKTKPKKMTRCESVLPDPKRDPAGLAGWRPPPDDGAGGAADLHREPTLLLPGAGRLPVQLHQLPLPILLTPLRVRPETKHIMPEVNLNESLKGLQKFSSLFTLQ